MHEVAPLDCLCVCEEPSLKTREGLVFMQRTGHGYEDLRFLL